MLNTTCNDDLSSPSPTKATERKKRDKKCKRGNKRNCCETQAANLGTMSTGSNSRRRAEMRPTIVYRIRQGVRVALCRARVCALCAGVFMTTVARAD